MPDTYGNFKGISLNKELPWISNYGIRISLAGDWTEFTARLHDELELARQILERAHREYQANRNRDKSPREA